MSVITDVKQYYRKNGIAPGHVEFRCEHFKSCKGDCPDFATAREPFIGGEYERCGNFSMPRLLFLSLDAGELESGESIEAQRTKEGKCKLDHDGLNKAYHWYRTHELAWTLLRQFNRELTIEDTCLYFAHTNSAKCCMNKDNHKMADRRMFRNCRAYIPGEIEALRPDILVTQGDNAKWAVESIPEIKQRRDGGILTLGDRDVRWIHSYHPNAYGKFNPQRRNCWPGWAAIIGRFWNERRKHYDLPNA